MIFTGTSGNLSTALYLASIIELSIGRPITRVQITALAWGVNILSGIVNTFGTRAVGALSAFNLWWTLGGTVVLVVTLLVKSPEKNTGTFVFTDYENFTGWSSKTFVVLLGFLQAVYTLEGCETAAQVAEETSRAEMLAPLAIISSIIGSWLIGVVYMLALLFSIRSISSIQATGFAIPIAQLFFDVFNDRTDDSDNGVIGAGSTKQGKSLTFMCIVIIALAQFMAAVTAFAASSRLLYSLARDNAVPTAHDGFYKKWFMALNRYQAPYVGVWISVIVGCAVSCAYIGSPIAFNAILSSAAISVMLSYLQPVIIRVFWPNSFRERGPFTLGKWSWPINVASFLFTVFVCVLFVLPTSHPVSSTTMNYAIVAVGALLLLVVLGWFAWGKDTFKGAVRTLEDEEAEEAEGDVVKETYDGLEKVPEKEKD
ncbi:hypothetical protein QCA50_016548 [Cerrena zonata]|uniref:Amino acid transporter n=1 Tax=Cerrena zonata TaxID=2478898 RepID=A0AAW0FH08_9APHY